MREERAQHAGKESPGRADTRAISEHCLGSTGVKYYHSQAITGVPTMLWFDCLWRARVSSTDSDLDSGSGDGSLLLSND